MKSTTMNSTSAPYNQSLSNAFSSQIFHNRVVPSQQVFISRKHVYAMVFERALVPGHVIVCPTRVVQHLKDLTELETLELFICAKEVAKKFEDVFNVRSLSIILQEGDNNGSTNNNLQLHLIPRDDNQENQPPISFNDTKISERNPQEMAAEAECYRKYFEKNDNITQFSQISYQ